MKPAILACKNVGLDLCKNFTIHFHHNPSFSLARFHHVKVGYKNMNMNRLFFRYIKIVKKIVKYKDKTRRVDPTKMCIKSAPYLH